MTLTLILIHTRFLPLSLHDSYSYPYTVLTHHGIQVMIDHANEEQDVRDLSNFLALLLRGAEVSTGASFIHSFIRRSDLVFIIDIMLCFALFCSVTFLHFYSL